MAPTKRILLWAELGLAAAAFLWIFFVHADRLERSVSRESGEPAPAAAGGRKAEHGAAAQRLDEIERRIFELTNRERQRRGLPALRPEETLGEIARRHSLDMLERGYFAHENPEGDSAGDRIAAGHRRLIGLSAENLWSGSGYDVGEAESLARKAMDRWMSSRGHRENILNPEYTHLGVGVVGAGSEIRATQNFALARAYLDHEMPESFAPGAVPDMRSSPFGELPAAERFTLWSSRRERNVTDPLPLATTKIDVEPGTYQLRFYFPQDAAGSYTIYYGPKVAVRREP